MLLEDSLMKLNFDREVFERSQKLAEQEDEINSLKEQNRVNKESLENWMKLYTVEKHKNKTLHSELN